MGNAARVGNISNGAALSIGLLGLFFNGAVIVTVKAPYLHLEITDCHTVTDWKMLVGVFIDFSLLKGVNVHRSVVLEIIKVTLQISGNFFQDFRKKWDKIRKAHVITEWSSVVAAAMP